MYYFISSTITLIMEFFKAKKLSLCQKVTYVLIIYWSTNLKTQIFCILYSRKHTILVIIKLIFNLFSPNLSIENHGNMCFNLLAANNTYLAYSHLHLKWHHLPHSKHINRHRSCPFNWNLYKDVNLNLIPI